MSIFAFLIYHSWLTSISGADVDPGIWAVVENCVGILSASLPTLRPIYNLAVRGHHCSSGMTHCSSCGDTRASNSGTSNRRSKGRSQARWPGSESNEGKRTKDNFSDVESQSTVRSQPLVEIKGNPQARWPGSESECDDKGMRTKLRYSDIESQSTVRSQPIVEIF